MFERERFEAWARSVGWKEEHLSKYPDVRNSYVMPYVQSAWQAWQGSNEGFKNRRLSPEAIQKLYEQHQPWQGAESAQAFAQSVERALLQLSN